MRKRWLTSLTLALGILATGARAVRKAGRGGHGGDNPPSLPCQSSASAPPRGEGTSSEWGTSNWQTPPPASLASPSPKRAESLRDKEQQSTARTSGAGTTPNQGWGDPAPHEPAAAAESGPSPLGRPVAELQRPVPLAGRTDSQVQQTSFHPMCQQSANGVCACAQAGASCCAPGPAGRPAGATDSSGTWCMVSARRDCLPAAVESRSSRQQQPGRPAGAPEGPGLAGNAHHGGHSPACSWTTRIPGRS